MAYRKRATHRNRNQENTTDEKATPTKKEKRPVPEAQKSA